MKGIVGLFVTVILIECSMSQENTYSETTNSTEGNMESSTDVNNEREEGEEELQSNDPSTIAFYLYPNAENQSYYEEIRMGESDSISESSYSPSKTPLLLIHGFVNNYTCKFSQWMKNAFLDAGLENKHNIIVVDWGAMSTPKNSTNLGSKPLNDLARNPFYQRAVQNVPKVGKRISEFINFLMMKNYLESPENVYLIGFSLGAHVAGCAGNEVKQNMSLPIGRITGIDPAGPLYQSENNGQLKLDQSDAIFVDVVHSNQGQSGYDGNCGDADFYANGGGPNQNDCIGGTTGVDHISGNMAGICAHNRAWIYYIKAMQTEVYACKCYATADYWCRVHCPSKTLFGYNAPATSKGKLVFVNREGPVCDTMPCTIGN